MKAISRLASISTFNSSSIIVYVEGDRVCHDPYVSLCLDILWALPSCIKSLFNVKVTNVAGAILSRGSNSASSLTTVKLKVNFQKDGPLTWSSEVHRLLQFFDMLKSSVCVLIFQLIDFHQYGCFYTASGNDSVTFKSEKVTSVYASHLIASLYVIALAFWAMSFL